MTDFLSKFKIPTILGLAVILVGLFSGLYLVLKEQIFLSQAAPDLTPQNITFTNFTDSSIVISWQTNSSTPSFITFGQNNPTEQTILDDRDTTNPKPHLTHYVTLKNLLPQTRYQFKIISGKLTSEVKSFDTTKPLANQTGFTPIIGSILDGDSPLKDGIVYLSIQGAITQSALIKTNGNFLIPLSQLRKSDLTEIFPQTEDIIAKITIISDKEPASLLFKLKTNLSPLPPIKLGQNIDLTIPEETPSPITPLDIDKYDLNKDGKINSTDYAIISSCFGKKGSFILSGDYLCVETDINADGKVDQKDLGLMSQKLTELGSQ